MLVRSLLFALLVPAASLAQSATFDLQANGKSVGHASYKLEPNKTGFKLSSRYGYQLNGVEFDSSDEYKYTPEYAYIEGSSQSLSSQMRSAYAPNKARTVLTIGMLQAGAQDSRQLAIKPDFVLLPHYDPGAAQAVLLLATTHPTSSNLYSVVVPASGTPPPRTGESDPDANQTQGRMQQSGNNAYDALWAKAGDVTGTLDGKPVPVHVYTLTCGKFVWTFLADDGNNLLQVNDSMVKASYVRAKFKLDAKP